MRLQPTRSVLAIQLGVVLVVCFAVSRLEADPGVEQEASAAFLINFLKFAYFPQKHSFETPPGKTRILCVGEDPLFGALMRLQARTNSQIEVKILPTVPVPVAAELLVIGKSERSRLRSILSQLQESPIYTASSMVGFARQGGMLEFGFSTNRINYQLNMDEIQAHHLTVSSRFLKLGNGKGETSP